MNTKQMKNNGTAVIFPGQGSQYVGMGKEFYNSYSVVRGIFEEASDVLHQNIKAICFEENEEINQTENTQPALLTVQYAMLRALEEEGLEADIFAGLSLGEYSAILAAGAMNFSDAVYLVRQRGRYMQEAAHEGEMMMSAIIGLSDDEADAICREVSDTIAIANYNAPGQIVIAGYKEEVLAANRKAEKAGAISAKPLNISVASHCFIQKEAAGRLKEDMAKIALNDLKKPYVSNFSAGIVASSEEIKDLLVKQLYSPVKWTQSVECLDRQGIATYYELGSGTLVKLIKRILRKPNTKSIMIPEDYIKHLGQAGRN